MSYLLEGKNLRLYRVLDFFAVLAKKSRPNIKKGEGSYCWQMAGWVILKSVGCSFFFLAKVVLDLLDWLGSHYPTAYFLKNTVYGAEGQKEVRFRVRLGQIVTVLGGEIIKAKKEIKSGVTVYHFWLNKPISQEKVKALENIMQEKMGAVYVREEDKGLKFTFSRPHI